ncbi:hypothetical protein GCM10011344_00820 [Dokdonia pacifica]|uniref:Uncharacterized protein n=1 Tax=Dokdonia pacifica TaxID=1627892 RepID=A0A239CZL2_9FLAO|nr:hypothetical protein [Dokdonia pacifica]GGG04302.1 hypothetical protein GCM10011344_00820 [Dokdonia pacifica]SNS25379.1 hypothetical protein SAMN06265376_10958 [Dokdonia pacifica]
MKTITLTIVLFLSFTLVGNSQKSNSKAVNKTLSFILTDYAKLNKAKPLSLKDYQRYLAKEKLNAKGMKIEKVVAINYLTKKNQKNTIYLIKTIKGISFSGPSCSFNDDLFGGSYENQCDTSGDEGDCEVITDTCNLDGCTVYCVVSSTCDGSNESYPNCCDGQTCTDGDGLIDDLMTPLETLMG